MPRVPSPRAGRFSRPWNWCRASRARRAWTRCRRWRRSPATRPCSLAATLLPRMFPMLKTAAGTVAAARVFVIGAGVAGLQAIATARRLGARVEAYDVRPAVKEQIQSLGARFVELPIEAGDAQDAGGYAKAQDESFYRRQREMMLKTSRPPTSSSRPRRSPARSRRSSSPTRWSKRCRPARSSSIWPPSAAATAS